MLALVNQRPQLLNIYQDSRTHDEHISGSMYTRYAVINQDCEDMGHWGMCADVWAIIISTLGRQDILGCILLVIFQDTPERYKIFGPRIVSETDIFNHCDFSCRAAGGICAIYLPRGGFHICSKANLQKIRRLSHKLIKSTQTD